MRIGICDDQQEVRELIAEKVQKIFPTVGIVVYPSGEEVLEKTPLPDILFWGYTDAGNAVTDVIFTEKQKIAIEHNSGESKRYIHIISYQKKNAYMIEIENSSTGKIELYADNGFPVTTKKEEEHGFGITNIQRVAQKYHGDIEIEQRQEKFKLSILLMIEE